MANIKIMRFVCNPLQENCYIVSDDTNEAVIIDCGAYYAEEKAAIKQYIADNNLSVKHLLVTHDHFDHVYGNDFVKINYALTPFDRSNETVTFGNHTFEIIHTPGHAPESVVYYCREEKIAFTGDTLFQGTLGRYDLPGGDLHDLVASLHKLIVVLPGDTQILPGHGEFSFIEDEAEWIKSF